MMSTAPPAVVALEGARADGLEAAWEDHRAWVDHVAAFEPWDGSVAPPPLKHDVLGYTQVRRPAPCPLGILTELD